MRRQRSGGNGVTQAKALLAKSSRNGHPWDLPVARCTAPGGLLFSVGWFGTRIPPGAVLHGIVPCHTPTRGTTREIVYWVAFFGLGRQQDRSTIRNEDELAAVANSRARTQLRRALEAHLTALGYTLTTTRPGTPVPEIARLNPLRSSVVYGETVLRSDLDRPACHERLLFFSQRRTRRRSSIPFFVGVAEADHDALETLLQKLDIHGFGRGSQVQIVPLTIEPPARAARPKAAKAAKRSR